MILYKNNFQINQLMDLAELLNLSYRTEIIPEKLDPGSGIGLKPPCDQDRANKKKFSQICPAVLEEISRKHTHEQTRKYRVAI